MNEGDNPAQAGWGAPTNYQRPARGLASSGSGMADAQPMRPLWDYATYHPGHGTEWMRKVGHDAMADVADPFNIPCIANETTRFPDNDNQTQHAYDSAASAALLCARRHVPQRPGQGQHALRRHEPHVC